MALKSENAKMDGLDRLKWLAAIVLLLAGLLANHYYSEIPMIVRTIAWMAVLALSAFVASKTHKGRQIVEFFRDSQMELRKVVWPTRERTMQTTMVVGAMVVILSLLLWGMDGILVWLIGWLTGQRG